MDKSRRAACSVVQPRLGNHAVCGTASGISAVLRRKPDDAPLGQSLYNSLQVTYNHRISKGLTALVSYTYSKFLDNVEGNNSWSYNGAANWGAAANYYNIAGEKSVDAGDIPHALVASYSLSTAHRSRQVGRFGNEPRSGCRGWRVGTFRNRNFQGREFH